ALSQEQRFHLRQDGGALSRILNDVVAVRDIRRDRQVHGRRVGGPDVGGGDQDALAGWIGAVIRQVAPPLVGRDQFHVRRHVEAVVATLVLRDAGIDQQLGDRLVARDRHRRVKRRGGGGGLVIALDLVRGRYAGREGEIVVG